MSFYDSKEQLDKKTAVIAQIQIRISRLYFKQDLLRHSLQGGRTEMNCKYDDLEKQLCREYDELEKQRTEKQILLYKLTAGRRGLKL